MWTPEELTWVFMGGLAAFFFILALFDDSDFENPDIPTYFSLMIRRPAMFFVSFGAWVIWGGMSLQLNNCSTQFGCFTDITMATPTSTITAESFAGAMGTFGYAMAVVTFILAFFFAVLNGYTIARIGYLGRRRKEQSPLPGA